jgi:hypothetical protein
MSYTDMARTQIQTQLDRFEEAISTMAWGIANQVLEHHRKNLAYGLTNIATKTEASPKKATPRESRLFVILNSKKGTWNRGSGAYRVLGPGKESGTFELENVATGIKINSTFRTLVSRWKHTP